MINFTWRAISSERPSAGGSVTPQCALPLSLRAVAALPIRGGERLHPGNFLSGRATMDVAQAARQPLAGAGSPA